VSKRFSSTFLPRGQRFCRCADCGSSRICTRGSTGRIGSEPTSPTTERSRPIHKLPTVTVDPARPYRPIPVGPSRPQETIFEFYFKALNPRKIHWGDEIDKRVEQFVDHSIRNPYFRFCAVQMGVILMLLALCWGWWDKLRQTKWITAEWLADAINAKQMSDQRAMDAIAAHNRHMESCNRVVEEQTSGIGKAIGYGPKFDTEKLNWELDFFKTHYFDTYLKHPLSPSEDAKLAKEFAELAGELESYASVLCHRDFHAANLMLDSRDRMRIIDHQDARIGSPTCPVRPSSSSSSVLARSSWKPAAAATREVKKVKPPETSRHRAPFAAMVRTRVRAPGLSLTRSS